MSELGKDGMVCLVSDTSRACLQKRAPGGTIGLWSVCSVCKTTMLTRAMISLAYPRAYVFFQHVRTRVRGRVQQLSELVEREYFCLVSCYFLNVIQGRSNPCPSNLISLKGCRCSACESGPGEGGGGGVLICCLLRH